LNVRLVYSTEEKLLVCDKLSRLEIIKNEIAMNLCWIKSYLPQSWILTSKIPFKMSVGNL